jgi:hypothetical protein
MDSSEGGSTSVSPQAEEHVLRDERWLLVQRILASRHFTKALQLREILLYVTRRILADEAAIIPEHEIAYKVLRRRETFNSNDDNIVRVQVGHLRKRLDQYFSSDGRDEPVILVIPKGSYVPSFEPRSSKTTMQQTDSAVEATNSSENFSSGTEPGISLPHAVAPETHVSNPVGRAGKGLFRPSAGLHWIGLSLAFLVCMGIAFYMSSMMRKPAPIGAANTSQEVGNLIVQRIFETGQPVSIIVTDSNLVLLQNVLHTDISIGDYIDSRYPANILNRTSDSNLRAALQRAAEGRYTSLGDLAIVSRCEEAARQYGTSSAVRYARYINARELEKGNLILIGSRRGNPWVSIFEPQLNFRFEEDVATHLFHFRNRHPAAGEQEIYSNANDGNGGYVSYVDIALLSNLSKTGYVLLLNGAVMDSNEAAADLIFGKKFPLMLSSVIGAQTATKSQAVEIFLRVHSVQGTANGFDVVGVRQLPL